MVHNSENKPSGGGAGKIVGRIIGVIVLLAIIFMIVFVGSIDAKNKTLRLPGAGSKVCLPYLSADMTPSIAKGDLVVASIKNHADVLTGAVAVYWKNANTLDIKIVSQKSEDGSKFYMVSDTNRDVSEEVDFTNVIGVANSKMGGLGGLVNTLASGKVIIIVLLIVVFIVVLLLTVGIFDIIRRGSKKSEHYDDDNYEDDYENNDVQHDYSEPVQPRPVTPVAPRPVEYEDAPAYEEAPPTYEQESVNAPASSVARSVKANMEDILSGGYAVLEDYNTAMGSMLKGEAAQSRPAAPVLKSAHPVKSVDEKAPTQAYKPITGQIPDIYASPVVEPEVSVPEETHETSTSAHEYTRKSRAVRSIDPESEAQEQRLGVPQSGSFEAIARELQKKSQSEAAPGKVGGRYASGRVDLSQTPVYREHSQDQVSYQYDNRYAKSDYNPSYAPDGNYGDPETREPNGYNEPVYDEKDDPYYRNNNYDRPVVREYYDTGRDADRVDDYPQYSAPQRQSESNYDPEPANSTPYERRDDNEVKGEENIDDIFRRLHDN